MSGVETKVAGGPREARLDSTELDAQCDFTAYLAGRLGIESRPAALHVLELLLASYQPIERRPISVLELAPSRRRAPVRRRRLVNPNALRRPGESSFRRVQTNVDRSAPRDDRCGP